MERSVVAVVAGPPLRAFVRYESGSDDSSEEESDTWDEWPPLPPGVDPLPYPHWHGPPFTPDAHRKYACKFCSAGFFTWQSAKSHEKYFHEPYPSWYDDFEDGEYPCEDCPAVFRSSMKLAHHARAHNEFMMCHLCDAGPFHEGLCHHLESHYDVRPYQCEHCDSRFRRLPQLENHVRTHTGEKPFKCYFKGCTKAFAQDVALLIHFRIHTGEKPHKCTECGAAFTQSGSLTAHKKRHNAAPGGAERKPRATPPKRARTTDATAR